MENNVLASISILVKDRKNNSASINKILTENGSLIMARLGVNLQRKCVENCQAMIVVAVEGKKEEVKELGEELQQTGAVVKADIFEE